MSKQLIGRITAPKLLTARIDKGTGMGELPSAVGLSEFPMPAYSATGTALASVQAAIAEKSGVEKPVFPEGWMAAVEGIGDGFKLICDAVIDVPQSDVVLSIVLDGLDTGNEYGDTYMTIFEFLGDIPTDTTVLTVYHNVALCGSNQSAHFTTFFAGSSSCVKAGVRSLTMYPSKNTIVLGRATKTALTVNVAVDNNNYATCRGQWHMRCYKVNSWEV